MGFVNYDGFEHSKIILLDAAGAEKALVGRHRAETRSDNVA
jgi:hypothetical protein